MIGVGKISRLRIWWLKAAELCRASLCGVLITTGLLSFAGDGIVFSDGGNVVRMILWAAFTLISVCGIYGRPRLLPKAFFALSQAAAAFLLPPDRLLLWLLQLFLYLPLLLLLLFGARWKGARLAALLLTLMLAFGVPSYRMPPPRRGIPTPLYLPASLASDAPGGWVLVFDDFVPVELLDSLSHRDGWLQINSARIVLEPFLSWYRDMRIEVAIVGDVERFTGPVLRKGVYRWLVGKLAPGGVLVMPLGETALLPSEDWRFSVLPGGDGEWVAARRGAALRVDPDTLEKRLQSLSRQLGQPVLPDGAVSAMYFPAAERAVVTPPPVRKWGYPRQWGVLAAVAASWLLLRLLSCRRAYMGTALAAVETTAAMMLYSLAMLPWWSGCMLDTGIMPSALFAGVGMLLLPRPFSAVRGSVWKSVQLGLGILPWVIGPGSCWLPLASWFWWFFAGAAVFTGLRAENRRAALIGAVCGIAAGVAVYRLIGADGSCLPVFAAILLMVPLSYRR